MDPEYICGGFHYPVDDLECGMLAMSALQESSGKTGYHNKVLQSLRREDRVARKARGSI